MGTETLGELRSRSSIRVPLRALEGVLRALLDPAHRMEADGSSLDDLVLALRYQDEVVRVGDGWKIIRRL